MDDEHGGNHMLRKLLLGLLLSGAFIVPARAQQATVTSACGTPPTTLLVGQVLLPFMDTGGHLCTTGGGAGNPGGSATQIQFNSGGTSFGGVAGATSNGTVITFANNDLLLTGSSTGTTTFNSANASATNYTVTFPANTGTVAETNLAQTFSAVQTFSAANGIVYSGAAVGTQVACLGLDASNNVVKNAAACGAGGGGITTVTNSDGTITVTSPTGPTVTLALALGHANTWTGVQSFSNGDLSLLGATSGNTLLEATAVAGAGTVATFPANTGIVAELNLAQTFSAVQTFSATNGIVYSGAAIGTQVACLGLDASNNVVKNAAACGGVTSVTNSDGTLTISPPTGLVVASLALGHANTWTGIQTFSTANGIVYSGAATGTQVACLGLDASNNVIKSGAACGSGGGGTPGGAPSNVQFNSAGAFGGDAGFTYTSLGQVTIAGGPITTNNKALTITQTWNNAATVFDAPLFMNITGTAYATLSSFIDIQQGGASVFRVGWDDNSASYPAIWLGAATPNANNFTFSVLAGSDLVVNVPAFSTYRFRVNNLEFAQLGAFGTIWGSNKTIGFAAGSNPAGAVADTALFRDAAVSVLALGNVNSPTTATGLRVYNTTDHVGDGTAPTNYERGVFDWTMQTSPVALSIGSQTGGTGSARPVLFVSSGMFAASGPALPACNTTAVPNYPNGTKGFQAVVSDATAPTYNATYTSGGAVVAHVVCNGTNWVTQ